MVKHDVDIRKITLRYHKMQKHYGYIPLAYSLTLTVGITLELQQIQKISRHYLGVDEQTDKLTVNI